MNFVYTETVKEDLQVLSKWFRKIIWYLIKTYILDFSVQ
jgi:hypothetical protein